MNNGLYKVEFQTQLGAGAGVVTLADGRLMGGDSALYYLGEYSLSGDQISATIKVDRHTHDSGMGSVFGIDRASLTLRGTFNGDSAQFAATAAEAPGVTMQGRLSRIA